MHKINGVSRIRVEDIIVPKKHRPLNEMKLPIIAESMKTLGLKTPITIRIGKKGPVLVTGRHRLEAAKSLGWTHIECLIMGADKIERQQWAIAENLHRAGQTRLQRAEQTQRWAKLLEQQAEAAQDAHPGGRQPHDKGVSKAAKKLGTSRDDVRRSKAIARLSSKAKKTAKEVGLDDDQAALLKAAKKSTPKKQSETLHKLAKHKKASGRRSLSSNETKQLKALERAFKNAPKFKKAWKRATAAVQRKFTTTILKPSI